MYREKRFNQSVMNFLLYGLLEKMVVSVWSKTINPSHSENNFVSPPATRKYLLLTYSFCLFFQFHLFYPFLTLMFPLCLLFLLFIKKIPLFVFFLQTSVDPQRNFKYNPA
jgi:hypothetical protein